MGESPLRWLLILGCLLVDCLWPIHCLSNGLGIL